MKLTIKESLDHLTRWFQLGLGADTEALRDAMVAVRFQPVAVVGSGASYSTAVLLSRCFESYLTCPSKALTPLDYRNAAAAYPCVVLISAGGQNADILAAQTIALSRQVKSLILITATSENLLVASSADYPARTLVVVPPDPLNAEDGFLGIVSMGAMWALITKAIYEVMAWHQGSLRDWIRDTVTSVRLKVNAEPSEVARRPHIVALGTGWASAVVSDFESKLVEGGLGWVETAETKHFTHGRYINSYRHSEATGIIVFSTAEDYEVAEWLKESYGKALLVETVISEHSSLRGAIELLAHSLCLVERVSDCLKVEVCRPSVPPEAKDAFRGLGLYPSPAFRELTAAMADEITDMKRAAAITENLTDVARLVPRSVVRAAYSTMLDTTFGGLMCDFDGTLVPGDSGNDVPDADICRGLNGLLKVGVPLAIVTGRGRSALRGLQACIDPSFLSSVSCFLYNGAARYRLDRAEPERVQRLFQIEEIADILRDLLEDDDVVDMEIASLSCQITVRLAHHLDMFREGAIMDRILERVPDWVDVRCSGRSIDLFPRGWSKLKAVEEFGSSLGEAGRPVEVLAIGDRGDRIGNDYEMLQRQFSISVDRFDWNPKSCFPSVDVVQDVRGPASTARILNSMELRRDGFRLRHGFNTITDSAS
jgi:hydroxymethylpyrimidine pyrophosphatase-like HAD family hydrolase/fructoselysine-6-P-deglycase FrlB-like protein